MLVVDSLVQRGVEVPLERGLVVDDRGDRVIRAARTDVQVVTAHVGAKFRDAGRHLRERLGERGHGIGRDVVSPTEQCEVENHWLLLSRRWCSVQIYVLRTQGPNSQDMHHNVYISTVT